MERGALRKRERERESERASERERERDKMWVRCLDEGKPGPNTGLLL